MLLSPSPVPVGRAGALLSGAGFGGIEFAEADEPMFIGRDVDDVLEYEHRAPDRTRDQRVADARPAGLSIDA